MKRILLFGAGKSATCLIDYLAKELKKNDWHLIVCDADLALAKKKTGNADNSEAVSINVEDEIERKKLVKRADIVISMLPPALHFLIAKDCVEFGKHLLTASYVDENTRSLENEIRDKKLLFLCEMGLDPGIDHMSAMKMINSVKERGGVITSFLSHCGGLIAPQSDNNPWHYKITWNPRNIVLAGKDGAEYLKDSKVEKVPYQSVFRNCTAVNLIGDYPLCWYPNRDSLHYIDLYGLHGIPTFIRTTLRHPSFCRGWNKFVNTGLTDTEDYEQIKDCTTFENWFDVKTARFTQNKKDWNNYLQAYITDPYKNEFHRQTLFLGIENNEPLPHNYKSSADILQYLVEKKLAIQPGDKDMIVMLHELEYTVDGQRSTVNSSLIVKGEDNVKTAMAKTVGLPLGIATKLILQDKIKLTGLHIPIASEIYEPVLEELEKNGIAFTDSN
ncbi:MAG TPA: saccharopine dehydrogenase C-terminal domain-containing protein [Chitinophagaceae bacterium]|nr:saccharopine dehydrogenase C-terminal domain-containing protein [Chitinophagaceae bacterium]